MSAVRCDFTELPVDQCAHCRPPVEPEHLERDGPQTVAAFPGRCVDCGGRIAAGDPIAYVNGEGWAHLTWAVCRR